MTGRRLVLLVLALPLLFVAEARAQRGAGDTIRVGIYSNPPKVFVNDQGRATGFWPELTRVIAKRNDWRIEWVTGTWAQGLKRLSAHRIDVLVDVGVTDARRERVLFGDETVHVSWSRVYARDGADIETVPDLAGRRIAGLEESFNLDGPEGLRSLLDSFRIRAEIVVMPTYDAVFSALDEGRVDAGITNRDFGNRMEGRYNVNRTPIVFQPAELRYAFPRDTSRGARLARSFDETLDALKEHEDSVFYRLMERWLGIKESRREAFLPEWLLISLVGLIAFSALVVGGLFLLEHRVRARTKELRGEVRARRLTEDRLQSILDNAPLAVYAKDLSGRFILVNRTIESIVGREREDIIGTTDFDHFPRAMAEAFWATDEDVLASGSAVTRDETVPVDGTLREFSSVKFPLRDDRGTVYAVCGISSDITERKRSEQLRAWQRRILELIVRPESPLGDVYAAVSQALEELGAVELASVVEVRQGQLAVASGPTPPTAGSTPGAAGAADTFKGCCVADAVAGGARAVVPDLHDAGVNAACRDFASSRRVSSCCAEPIPGADGRVLGALCTFFPGHGPPDGWQTQVVQGLAQLCGIAIERTEAEQESRLFAQIYASTSEAMLVLDSDLTIARVNRAFCELVGRDAPDILGQRPDAYLAAGALDAIRGLCGSSLAGDSWSGETAAITSGQALSVWAQIDGVRDPDGGLAYVVAMLTDIRELKRTQEEVEYLAYHDPLTRLPNRRALDGRMEDAIHRAERAGGEIAVMFLDLDRFKNINDSFGHAVGDGLLVQLADRLQQLCRKEDFVARLSGDEFALVVEDIDGPEQLSRLLERILQLVARPYEVLERHLHVTVSIGLSIYPDDADSVVELLRNADTAMYRAKEAGGQRYLFYSEDMTRRAYDRVVIENELRKSLRSGGLALHYQAQFDHLGQRVVGCEALCRWDHLELGPVSPARFIPVAEETGLINELGVWTLETACRQAREWLGEGLGFGRVAVNVSPLHLQSGSLPADVKSVLDRTGLDGAYLEIEVTEGFILQSVDRAIEQLAAIRALGVSVAIDDFGTGYSSLSYLKQLPVNRLKIDKAFVDGLPSDPDDAAIVRTIIAMGQSMGLGVIAEGVETQEQLEYLADNGCNEIQGFLFARPADSDAIRGHLRRPPASPP